jgi:3-oxoacyl-[acyl-carrier-protein] synthase II
VVDKTVVLALLTAADALADAGIEVGRDVDPDRIGVVVGGVGAVYLAELQRLRDGAAAGKSTWAVLKAVGIGMLVELVAAVLMLGTWLLGVWVT